MLREKGFTLIEMMIAFALSATLIMGLLQIFNSNKEAFGLQSNVARIQESGRVSMEILSRDLRNASFMGCATGGFGDNFTNHVDASKYASGEVQQALSIFDGDNAIVGFDNVTAIAAGSTLDNFGISIGTATGELVSGTDIIILQNAAPCDGGKVVVGGTGTAQIKIQDAAACGIGQDDIVIVSNCSTAEAFGVTNNPLSGAAKDTLAHGSNLNINNKLSGTYDDDSFVYKPKSTIYYVGNGSGGEPALFMRSLVDVTGGANAYTTYELAEGIEDLQILYGEDTNDNQSADRYVPAGTAALDMNNVVSVRTALLVRSDDNITTTNQSYTYAGVATVAGDLRMRVPYETTTTIRNRVN